MTRRHAAWRSPLTRKQRAFWDEHGFLVLPRFYSPRKVRGINRLVDDLWEQRGPDTPLVVDLDIESATERRAYFRDAPPDARERPYKLNDLFLVSPEVRELALSSRLAAVLRALVGGDVMICNTLYFERGSQQAYHFDTYYMPHPSPGGLVVTSICLEAHHADAGPLTYYPGSHKIPPYQFSNGARNAIASEMPAAQSFVAEEIATRGLEAEQFAGGPGDVFIWHEQLYHGGSPIIDPLKKRRSLVTHYWRVEDFPIGDPWRCEPMGKHRWYLGRPHPVIDAP